MLRTPRDLLPDTAPGPLHRFVAYWLDKAGDRRVPDFRDIDPVEIPWALRQLYVVRAVDGGSDFVYRLSGEEFTWRYGFPIAGKRISDLLAPDAAAGILDCWTRIIRTPAAYYSVVQHLTVLGLPLIAQRVTLPLGPADGPPDHIIGMALFETVEARDDLLLEERDVRQARWVDLHAPAEAVS
jgi:hypothetical protein